VRLTSEGGLTQYAPHNETETIAAAMAAVSAFLSATGVTT
jgi:hypothetical protein